MILVYSKKQCPFCDMAKNFLKTKNINFQEISLEENEDAKQFMISQGHRTVPQIYMNGELLVEGGWSGLRSLSDQELMEKLGIQ